MSVSTSSPAIAAAVEILVVSVEDVAPGATMADESAYPIYTLRLSVGDNQQEVRGHKCYSLHYDDANQRTFGLQDSDRGSGTNGRPTVEVTDDGVVVRNALNLGGFKLFAVAEDDREEVAKLIESALRKAIGTVDPRIADDEEERAWLLSGRRVIHQMAVYAEVPGGESAKIVICGAESMGRRIYAFAEDESESLYADYSDAADAARDNLLATLSELSGESVQVDADFSDAE